MNWKIWEAPVDEPEKIERRKQELETRKARQGHEMSLAELDDQRTEVRQSRKERRADRREERALARLNRQARVSGSRIRMTYDLYDSGEIRALRIRKIRKSSLLTLLPVLLAFAAWSTIGVHAGVVKLLGAEPGSAYDTGAWFVEPAIIVIVAGIIVVRAALRSAGGELDWRATMIEWGMLSSSVALNLAGAWPEGGFLEGAAATVAHSLGPVGAMVTAVLISIVDDAVANAKPFEGKKSFADPVLAVDVVPSQVVPPSRGTELGQDRDNEVGQDEEVIVPKVSRPKPAPRPIVPPEPGTDLVPVSRPKVSQNEQFDKIVKEFEAQRDAGQPATVRAIADLTGASKTTVGRVLKTYLAEVEA